ncbi:hypothetical protein IC229_29070 [Spirosoma sp. BT702]|uniref:Uncharacterized protein n=1 Tax=Spirosoma profusum TaxID=2771354 RepID=A0A927G9M6_9BACT|nr:hypothetical protein [Spirosoma profusum]MBD2704722.1 hypothetical protein [Spirosoma profusum]
MTQGILAIIKSIIKQQLIQLLTPLRINKSLWPTLSFRRNPDEDAICEDVDVNFYNRNKAIYALHFDFQDSDYELIKFCFEQEIEMARESACSFEGSRLVAFLLARFKKVENCLLFADMKFANFDNKCGFDREFFFSAGINQTAEFINAVEDSGLKSTLTYDFLIPSYFEYDILEWFAQKNRYFSHLNELNQEDEEVLLKELHL